MLTTAVYVSHFGARPTQAYRVLARIASPLPAELLTHLPGSASSAQPCGTTWRAPVDGDRAVLLDPWSQGLGSRNSTASGWRPFFVTHPCLTEQLWMMAREEAIPLVRALPSVSRRIGRWVSRLLVSAYAGGRAAATSLHPIQSKR